MRLPLVTVSVLGALLTLATDASAQRYRYLVESTPPGASVHIDGATESSGTTPVWLRLRRGTRNIEVRLPGYIPAQHSVNVRRNWQRVHLTLTPIGVLQLDAADETAAGATVSVDGTEVGTIPLRHPLEPGRHSYRIEREGYHPLDRWVEISGGQTFSTEVTLRPLPPPTGTILIAADVTGAQVLVDGTPVGTTPMIHDAEPGDHTVEVRADDYEPQSQVVRVVSGERVTVNVTLRPERPPGGTLVILTTPTGAVVAVDGEERGTAPLTIEGLAPGTHIVEARADGRQPATERAVIEADQQQTIQLQLEEIPRGASLRVSSSVVGAQVLLDGVAIGITPLVQRDIEPGEHILLVRSQGHHDWERRLVLEAGVELLVEATPDAFGRITVNSETEGAEVVIDGTVVGPVPLTDHEISTGDHEIEIRAEGYQPFRTSLTVEAGGSHHLGATLTAVPAPVEEPVEAEEPAERPTSDRSGPRFSRAGFGLTPLAVSVDVAGGWPYVAGYYRVGLGLWDGLPWARLDAAVEVRSSVWMTEIDARLRFGTRFVRWLHLGAELSLGGGVGRAYDTTTEHRGAFVLGFTLLEGLAFGPVAFGIHQRLEVFIDTHGQEGNDGLVRQASARVFVGGYVEWSIIPLVHVFVTADYAPVQPSRRILCADAWDAAAASCGHAWMRDINLNVQAGVGMRFN